MFKAVNDKIKNNFKIDNRSSLQAKKLFNMIANANQK